MLDTFFLYAILEKYYLGGKYYGRKIKNEKNW